MTFTNDEGEAEGDLTYNRQDFWATTSNKQLNFVQHIRTMLKTTGRAAVVVPDNVLFEGGAGETIRRKLLADDRPAHDPAPAHRHLLRPGREGERDLLRQPRGLARIRRRSEVWYYDYRTNVHHTLKKKPLRFEDLADFVALLQPGEPPRAQGDLERGEPRGPLAALQPTRSCSPATRRASISSG